MGHPSAAFFYFSSAPRLLHQLCDEVSSAVSTAVQPLSFSFAFLFGALEREVLTQFLGEAVVLSSFGGLIGIAIALAGSLWLSAVLQVPFVFNGGIVFVAFLFSARGGNLRLFPGPQGGAAGSDCGAQA